MSLCLLPIGDAPPIRLDQAIVLVGRHPSCDVILSQSLKVSRKHCCIVQVSDRSLIRDLGSLNGVWVNGRRIEREAVLRVGDEVRIADVAYVVQELADAQKEAPAVPDFAPEDPGPVEGAAARDQLSPASLAGHGPALRPKTPLAASSDSENDFLQPADAEPEDSGDALPSAED